MLINLAIYNLKMKSCGFEHDKNETGHKLKYTNTGYSE
jgi:hypothetical protein